MEQQAVAQTKIPFDFQGRGGEYFGIWIVNLLLTIITVGIYTPWAKVRTKRYFYGKTFLNNTNFSYLADPIAILKGWLIAVAVFIVYSVSTNFVPVLELLFMILFVLVLPLLVVRSMAFRARNSAWQNIRFDFKGRYGEAFKVFILWGVFANILSLGLLFPYVQYRQTRFLLENSGYGKSDFEFKAKTADFYIIYLIVLGIMTLFSILMVAAGAGVGAMMEVSATLTPEERYNQIAVNSQMVMVPLMMLMYFFIFAYVQSRVGNLVWSNVKIKENGMESTMRARDLMWIYFTNILAITLSFGLLVPWARVRATRYRFDKLQLIPAGNLDQFVQAERNHVNALGEEMGDVFDIDIGI
ncbi:MAG: YjgN family protein [Gammaproteobacteria bacterium]|jgi:uncharacterized membrane protein YjgN (DUF898 family)